MDPDGVNRNPAIRIPSLLRINFVMDDSIFIKPIPLSDLQNIIGLAEYQQNNIVQKMLVDNKAISISILSFDKGKSFTNQTDFGEAMAQVLEGGISIMDGTGKKNLCAGDVIVLPANTKHQVKASERAKILYTIVKDPKIIRIET